MVGNKKSTFAVLLEDAAPGVLNRAIEAYGSENVYQVAETSFLVNTNESTGDVAETCGILGEDRLQGAYGAVFLLTSSNAGFAEKKLWRWLGRH